MEYKQFENYMLLIKKSLDTQKKHCEAININFYEVLVNNILDAFINLIEQQFNDPFNTVSWFIFDRNFGKDDPIIEVKDKNKKEKIYNINSIEALWNFLMLTKSP